MLWWGERFPGQTIIRMSPRAAREGNHGGTSTQLPETGAVSIIEGSHLDREERKRDN